MINRPEGVRVPQENEVLIYTKSPCPHCGKAKTWFKIRGIKPIEISLSEHPEIIDHVQALGFRAFPVIDTVDGAMSFASKADEKKFVERFGEI